MNAHQLREHQRASASSAKLILYDLINLKHLTQIHVGNFADTFESYAALYNDIYLKPLSNIHQVRRRARSL